jgi:hypothetical protein
MEKWRWKKRRRVSEEMGQAREGISEQKIKYRIYVESKES